MLLKFIARGTGSAAAAAAYLTRETDSAGKERAEVAVLRGDPDQVAAVADALEFEQKYTSAVIAWAPEDQPSDAQVDRVVDEFEDTAWPGLAADRYAWTAVRHREDRAGVVAALKEAGFEVPREGKHYVTVLNPNSGDRWRLKGALYEHDYQRERVERPAAAADRDRAPEDGRDRRARAAEVWRDVARQRERQAAYQRSRYGGAGRADSRAAVARLAPAPGGRAVRASFRAP